MDMYKKVTTAGIIGRFYVGRVMVTRFSEDLVRDIFAEIRRKDEFIACDGRYKGLIELCGAGCVKDGCLEVPSDTEVRKSLKREYYKMDADTRAIVSGVVEKYLKRYKDGEHIGVWR